MLLKVFNKALTQDREKTYLTAAAAAAATSITVAGTDLAPAATSSDTWTDNDYMIVGEPGQEATEIMQVNGAITLATSITIDRSGQVGGLRFTHPVGTPVYRIDYNRVEFSQNTSDTTSGVSVLATIRIQPDDDFTRYEDTSNITGYGFARFNNETSGAFSSYSDGTNYDSAGVAASRDPRTLWQMRKKVRTLLDETEVSSKLTDDLITEALNDKQREIAHMRLWTFFETEKSFSGLANQFAYTLPSTVQLVHGVRYDTMPLSWMTKAEWDIRHTNTSSTSSTPSNYSIWNGEILVYPALASAAQSTTTNGVVTLAGITITVTSTSGFNKGDFYRFIIDSEVIYAIASTSTTFTQCLRGREGTTATTHLTATTVTERDIVYNAHVEPTDLIDTQDRTPIPEAELLTYGTVIDLAPFVGRKDLIPVFEAKYNARIKELEAKYSSKQSMEHGRIKDMYERNVNYPGRSDPNLYPRSITQ